MGKDTSPEADAAQIAALRRMSGAERVEIAIDMSNFVREVACARIRAQHADWSDDQVKREYLRRLFPPDQIPAYLR